MDWVFEKDFKIFILEVIDKLLLLIFKVICLFDVFVKYIILLVFFLSCLCNV